MKLFKPSKRQKRAYRTALARKRQLGIPDGVWSGTMRIDPEIAAHGMAVLARYRDDAIGRVAEVREDGTVVVLLGGG